MLTINPKKKDWEAWTMGGENRMRIEGRCVSTQGKHCGRIDLTTSSKIGGTES